MIFFIFTVAILFSIVYNKAMENKTLKDYLRNSTIVHVNTYSKVYRAEDGSLLRLSTLEGLSVVRESKGRFYFVRQLLFPDEMMKDDGESQPSFHQRCLSAIPELEGGKMISTFQTGGGIVKVAENRYYRISVQRGLQRVRKGLDNWRTCEQILTSSQLKAALCAKET